MAETPLHSVKIMSSNAREEEAWEPTQEALRLTDKYYIERRVDAYLKGILHRRHLSATITIYGSHQSGKSSLLIRGLYDARQTGAKVVLVDMQSLSDQCFTSLDNLNYSLAEILFRKLQLDVGKLRDLWNHELTSWNKLHHLIEDYILPQIEEPIIIAIDEADRVLGTNFHDSFFGYIRSLHSARVMGDNFDRLCVIVVTTNPAFLITNPNTSPFNNGPFIHLDDFSKDEIIELSQTYELIIDESDVAELMDLLNGHPYLTHLTFELLSSKQFSWKELKSIALTENSPFIIHLQQISRFIQHKPYLRNTLKTIINIGSYSDEFALFQLEQIGLVTRNRCRCNLYKSYFADKLLSNLDLDTISVTDEERQGIESLLKAQRRRLHKLQEQVATMGSYTPPHILTEIEDLQTEITRSETLLSTITGISQ